MGIESHENPTKINQPGGNTEDQTIRPQMLCGHAQHPHLDEVEVERPVTERRAGAEEKLKGISYIYMRYMCTIYLIYFVIMLYYITILDNIKYSHIKP